MEFTDDIIKQRMSEVGNRETGLKPFDCTPHNMFPNNEEELIEYLKTSKAYCLSTYGGRLGHFKAVSQRYSFTK